MIAPAAPRARLLFTHPRTHPCVRSLSSPSARIADDGSLSVAGRLVREARFERSVVADVPIREREVFCGKITRPPTYLSGCCSEAVDQLDPRWHPGRSAGVQEFLRGSATDPRTYVRGSRTQHDSIREVPIH